jgi:hypothetical protein
MILQAESAGGLPTPAIVALIALGAVQLTIQIIALVDLSRRSVFNNAPKWLWAVIIVLGNLIGALAYLFIGRKVPAMAEGDGPHAGGEVARRRALDTLYGSDKTP